MSKVEGGGEGPIDPPPPSRLRVAIFSRRLLRLILVNAALQLPPLSNKRLSSNQEKLNVAAFNRINAVYKKIYKKITR